MTEPIDPQTERLLGQIAEIARNVRATWFALLGFLAFAGVTLLGVEDADFFAFGRETALPLVGVTIPTRSFFWTAPLLLAALYVYFQLQLRQLWRALALALCHHPAETLKPLIHPGLLTEYGLDLAGACEIDPLARLQRFVLWLLVWLAAPLVLVAFWWRAMPAHDEWLTLTGGAAVLVALYVGRANWTDAHARLHPGRARAPGRLRRWARRVLAALAVVVVALVSWLRTEGGLDHYAERAIASWNAAWPQRPVLAERGPRRAWIAAQPWLPAARFAGDGSWPWSPARLLAMAPVDLTDVELVPRPADWRDHDIAEATFRDRWCRERGVCGELSGHQLATYEETWRAEREAALANLAPLSLAGADLRAARLAGAFAVGVDFTGARLDGAGLRDARVEAATFRSATLRNAAFVDARLENASFYEATFDGADFWRARLDGALLRAARGPETRFAAARLRDVHLVAAELAGADFHAADLRGADLMGAMLPGANFTLARLDGARLERARLRAADFEGASLVSAGLEGAALTGANLAQARLTGAALRGADLAGAVLAAARLDGVEGLDPRQLRQAIGSAETVLPAPSGRAPPLWLRSCWPRPPATLAQTLATLDNIPAKGWRYRQRKAAFRARWLCNGRPPERVGTLAAE